MALRRLSTILLALCAWSGIQMQPVLGVEMVHEDQSQCIDVCLATGGMLTGQIVDPRGVPRAHDQVAVFYGDQAVAKTSTDADGRFSIAGIRGGRHDVATKGGCQSIRCWTPTSAPPHAISSVLVQDNGLTVCGQEGEINPQRIKLLTLTALGLSVTALSLSILLPIVLDDDENAS
jgi:hypothetical protein